MAYQEFMRARDDKHAVQFSVSECNKDVWLQISFTNKSNTSHDFRLLLTPDVAAQLGRALVVKANVVIAAIEAGDDPRAFTQAVAEATAAAVIAKVQEG